MKNHKIMTLEEFEKYMDEKIKELDENPVIKQNNAYGRQLRKTLIQLGEEDDNEK